MYSITVPKLNNNDESCVLRTWLEDDAQAVEAQKAIAVLETSKATVDLEIEAAGLLHRLVEPGSECPFGSVIGYVFEDESERQGFLTGQKTPGPAAGDHHWTITQGASELIERHQITEAQLLSLGKSVIKRSDIETLLDHPPIPATKRLTLSRLQSAVAETVTQSHQNIPWAFLVMKVYCDQALARLKEKVAQEETVLGLPELVIKVMAAQSTAFPFFFAQRVDLSTFIPATQIHIGVTFDIGKGLFIPVVKDVNSKTLSGIAETLLGYRLKLFQNAFKEEDFQGGQITLSLTMDKDVFFSLPIILPTQNCMLSLSAVQEELYLGDERNLSMRSYVNFGLTYDHRVINGHDAVRFLRAIKSNLESPVF